MIRCLTQSRSAPVVRLATRDRGHAVARWLPLVVLVLAAGCARTPAARYYLLDATGTPPVAGERTGPLVGLGPVALPGYLDRPQIVTRSGNHQLKLLPQDRWAEPFSESFERLLRARLAEALPNARVVGMPWKASSTPARRVALQLERLDQGPDGSLVLVARWTVADGDEPVGAQHVSNIAVPAGGDTASLVAAHAEAIGRLAAEIAAALR